MPSAEPGPVDPAAAALVSALSREGLTLGCAESLTGGLLAATIVSVPGASQVLRGGVVAYAAEVKESLLGVDGGLLAAHGTVHPDVALQMAVGARRLLGCDLAIVDPAALGRPLTILVEVELVSERSDDIDATMDLVQEHGGTVHMEPVDVGTLGRMAVAVTPGGEYVGFWQPGEFSGHDLPLAPGTSVWFEVVSKDFSADAGFYRAVCGWDVVPMGAEGQGDDGTGSGDEPAVDGESPGYATNGAGEAATAGLCDAAQWLPDDVPSHWRVYFRTTEMAGSVRTLEEHGGRVVDGPMDSPFGVVATALDPAGATFQLI